MITPNDLKKIDEKIQVMKSTAQELNRTEDQEFVVQKGNDALLRLDEDGELFILFFCGCPHIQVQTVFTNRCGVSH